MANQYGSPKAYIMLRLAAARAMIDAAPASTRRRWKVGR